MPILLSIIQENKAMNSPLFGVGAAFLTAVVLAVSVRGLIIWFVEGARSTKTLA
jgi:hypothetical protein